MNNNNQDINVYIEDFKQDIIDKINTSGLPASVIYYVMKDIYSKIESEYTSYIRQSRQQLEQMKRQQEEETNKVEED